MASLGFRVEGGKCKITKLNLKSPMDAKVSSSLESRSPATYTRVAYSNIFTRRREPTTQVTPLPQKPNNPKTLLSSNTSRFEEDVLYVYNLRLVLLSGPTDSPIN